jgi:hypothetical protein
MDQNAIDPSKIDLSKIDPRLVREMLVMDGLFKLQPPMTQAQAAARHRADEALRTKYPKQYVAYVDSWSGDELKRVVVAASGDWDEYQAQLGQVTPDVRKYVEITRVRDPEEGVFGGAQLL